MGPGVRRDDGGVFLADRFLMCVPSPVVMPRHAGHPVRGIIRSITNVSGILDRPIKPDDDS